MGILIDLYHCQHHIQMRNFQFVWHLSILNGMKIWIFYQKYWQHVYSNCLKSKLVWFSNKSTASGLKIIEISDAFTSLDGSLKNIHIKQSRLAWESQNCMILCLNTGFPSIQIWEKSGFNVQILDIYWSIYFWMNHVQFIQRLSWL